MESVVAQIDQILKNEGSVIKVLAMQGK